MIHLCQEIIRRQDPSLPTTTAKRLQTVIFQVEVSSLQVMEKGGFLGKYLILGKVV